LTQCERPELRRFDDNDLIATVFRDRAKLLAAALTILRAHHLAGRPTSGNPLGSFETWSGWPRAALVWLGEADPCETMERVREDDPRRKALANVLIPAPVTCGLSWQCWQIRALAICQFGWQILKSEHEEP
jgi:hypothetical protein